ncbi:acyl carrier protein [Lacibacter sp. MH-610]|uniref:acyl carrier protein n=1 Tax=Lacibacter sp. MH-610 TaxID=3020883 RepID=UPI003892AB65
MNLSYHQLTQTINRLLKLQPGMVTTDTNLKDELGLTDWELTLLVNQLERKYHIEFQEQEVQKLQTVEALVRTMKFS